jgi:hypothetical protein
MHAAAAIITVALIAGCAADEPGAAPEPSASIPPSASPSGPPDATPDEDEPDATATPSPSPTATSSPAPSPSPTATSSPLAGIRLQIACDRLLTPQDVYDYNPNIGADPGYRVRAGSGPARAVELSGTACGWLNQTSTQTYSIGVARFDSANLQRVKSAAASAGGTTRGLGMEGYYRTEAGLGVVEAFTGSYWITAESTAFLEPADVAPLLEAIRRNLP